MEKIKLKYAPMIIVIYFSVMGLVIAFILKYKNRVGRIALNPTIIGIM